MWTLFGLFLYKQRKGHRRLLICIEFSRLGFHSAQFSALRDLLKPAFTHKNAAAEQLKNHHSITKWDVDAEPTKKSVLKTAIYNISRWKSMFIISVVNI